MCGKISLYMKNRKFISIYFKDMSLLKRKKRDLTLSFTADDPLYKQCKSMTSKTIKELIGLSSYSSLVIKANKENRTFGNYIKNKLNKKLGL